MTAHPDGRDSPAARELSTELENERRALRIAAKTLDHAVAEMGKAQEQRDAAILYLRMYHRQGAPGRILREVIDHFLEMFPDEDAEETAVDQDK